jgi:iron complex transport system substrate-binding protein
MDHLPTAHRLRAPLSVAITAGLALILTACGGAASSSTSSAGTSAAGETTVSTAFGDVVTPASPERVVTLAESALDVALAVGITPVGTTASRGGNAAPAYLGTDAADIPIVASVAEPNLEAIVETDPDLILAGSNLTQEQYDALSAIAPTVAPKAPERGEWETPLHTYGEALGADDVLTEKLDDVADRAQALADEGSVEGTFAVVRWMANGPVLMNSANMPGSLLQAAGATPMQAAADLGDQPHSDPLSLENLDQVDADRLFVAAFGADGKTALDAAQSQPAFARLKAVESGTTAVVDGSVWSSASGPTAASLVLDDIEKAVA